MENDFEAECKVVFDLFDCNNNGFIEPRELADGLRALGGNPTDEEVEELIRESENKRSEDGCINIEEFVALMQRFKRCNEKEEEDLMNAFKCFDANGDGKIKQHEMKNALMRTGACRLSEEEAEQLFEAADTDHNGCIEYKELVRLMMK